MTESDILTIIQAINIAVKQGAAFFAYVLPNDDVIHFGAQHSGTNAAEKSFYIHPFVALHNCQPHKIVHQLSAEQFASAYDGISNRHELLQIHEHSTSQDEYMDLASKCVDTLRQGLISKIVISRAIVKRHYISSWGDAFVNLAKSTPSAFTFIFNHPDTGAWIGASPELLLSGNNGICRTMALAATKPSDSSRPWSKKEIIEQRIVSEFISDSLKQLGIPFICSNAYNRKAAGVQHICTDFSAQCPKLLIHPLIAELHPTPALSGFPQKEAIDFITRHETHHRNYYGGFLGPESAQGDFRFYVNLRSMQFDKEKCCIYVGGGFTADSSPIDEWYETEIKAQLLKNLLQSAAGNTTR